MTLMAILASGSRASLFGFLVGGITFLGFRHSDTRAKVLLTLLVVYALLVVIGLPDVLLGAARTDSGWRFDLWQRAFELGKESPLHGIGFGSTSYLFEADKQYLLRRGIYAAGSHNEYMRIFVALGVPGLALALIGFTSVIWKTARLIRQEGRPVLPVSLLAAVMSGLANAVFEDWIFAFGGAPAFPFWFFLAILAFYGHRWIVLPSRVFARFTLGSSALSHSRTAVNKELTPVSNETNR
jgi:O-antigen ligase